MSRISDLKIKAFKLGESPKNHIEADYWKNLGLVTYSNEYAHNLKRGKIDAMILDNYSIEIDPQELLVGRMTQNFKLNEDMKKIVTQGNDIHHHTGSMNGAHHGSTGHRVIDYEKLLNLGIKGVLAEIDDKLSKIDYLDPDAAEKNAFYTASKLSLESVCRFAKRYEAALLELYDNEKDITRKKEYLMMAKNFKHAPYQPCTSFYEAMQCMWFMQFILRMLGDITLTGRMDNYLLPFYEKDIKNNVITKEFAFELIENLYLKHNEIYGSWPASIMVGGVDRQGNPVWNDISYMCIKAIETTGLINPSVSVCYTQDMPDDLLELCIDIISKGYTKPSIFNDRIVQEGLIDAGVSIEDARYYIHSTCVEITTIGNSNISVATPYININKSIEYILNDKKPIFGEECHVAEPIDFKLDELDAFEKFYALVKDVVSSIIKSHLVKVCDDILTKKRYMSCPLASAFLDDCIELGKDSAGGGAKYNFVYPCFPGFLNMVDILSAVKYAVYDENLISLEELRELCSTNFKDAERLRGYLINKCPKFGNDDDFVDTLGVQMYDFLRDELKKYKTCLNGTFHPSYFAWIMHGYLGELASATPDGRKQGEALSESLTSVQGMDRNGPIGVMRSIEKIDQKYGIGGIATNIRFSKRLMQSKEGKQAVIDYTKTFMDNNCFEIQFNVVDQKALIEAQKNPEKYKTLMVRVAGYSDYFVNLSPVIQNEILKRSEHDDV